MECHQKMSDARSVNGMPNENAMPPPSAIKDCLEHHLVMIRTIAWGEYEWAEVEAEQRLDKIGALADLIHNLPKVLAGESTFLYNHERDLLTKYQR